MKIFFIVVNHDQHEYLYSLIEDILSLSDTAELVTVNNGTKDFNFDTSDRVHVINVENEGYIHGLKSGVEFIHNNGLSSGDDVVALSNPDIRLSSDFFEEVKNIPKEVDSVWMIAPDIEESNSGKKLNPNMRIRMSNLMFMFNRFEMFSYLSFRLVRRMKAWARVLKKALSNDPRRKLSKCEIFAPHGSFMITSTLSISKSGMLEHPIFLWGEEVCIAFSIRQAGGAIVYDPDIKVYHAEHSATSKIPSHDTYQIWKRSFAVYKKYLK